MIMIAPKEDDECGVDFGSMFMRHGISAAFYFGKYIAGEMGQYFDAIPQPQANEKKTKKRKRRLLDTDSEDGNAIEDKPCQKQDPQPASVSGADNFKEFKFDVQQQEADSFSDFLSENYAAEFREFFGSPSETREDFNPADLFMNTDEENLNEPASSKALGGNDAQESCLSSSDGEREPKAKAKGRPRKAKAPERPKAKGRPRKAKTSPSSKPKPKPEPKAASSASTRAEIFANFS